MYVYMYFVCGHFSWFMWKTASDSFPYSQDVVKALLMSCAQSICYDEV